MVRPVRCHLPTGCAPRRRSSSTRPCRPALDRQAKRKTRLYWLSSCQWLFLRSPPDLRRQRPPLHMVQRKGRALPATFGGSVDILASGFLVAYTRSVREVNELRAVMGGSCVHEALTKALPWRFKLRSDNLTVFPPYLRSLLLRLHQGRARP